MLIYVKMKIFPYWAFILVHISVVPFVSWVYQHGGGGFTSCILQYVQSSDLYTLVFLTQFELIKMTSRDGSLKNNCLGIWKYVSNETDLLSHLLP